MWPSAVCVSYHLFLHAAILNPPAALWNTGQRSSLYHTSDYSHFHSVMYCTSAPFWCLVIGLLSFLLSSHWSDNACLSPLLDCSWCSLWPWTLEDEVTYSFEMLGHICLVKQHHIPEGWNPSFFFTSLHVPSSYCSLCETHWTVADGYQPCNTYVCILSLSIPDSRRLRNSE